MFCQKCGSRNDDQAKFCQACGANLKAITTEPYAQPVVSSNVMRYAGFWRRFGANFIDGLIFLPGISVIAFIFGFIFGPYTPTGEGDVDIRYIILGAFIGWIYYAAMESSPKQATLGKIALGIVVTDLAGNRISFGKATRRYFGKIVVSLLTLWIGFLTIGFTKRKQGLHDMMAGCLVVNK